MKTRPSGTWLIALLLATPPSLAGSIVVLLVGVTMAVPSRGSETATGVFEATIVDAGSGAPLTGRVYATGSDGRPCFDPEGVPFEKPERLERAGTTGAHFATTGNRFTLSAASGRATELATEVELAESGWLAVRCFEKRTLNHRAAHSAPVHVTVAGRPFVPVSDSLLRIVAHIEGIAREVATVPIDTSEAGHVKSEEHRQELLALYEQAADHYRGQVAGAR